MLVEDICLREVYVVSRRTTTIENGTEVGSLRNLSRNVGVRTPVQTHLCTERPLT